MSRNGHDWHYGDDGATPVERMHLHDSQIHHIHQRIDEDRSHRNKMDDRLRGLEITVGHSDKVLGWMMKVAIGTAVGVLGGIGLEVIHLIGRLK